MRSAPSGFSILPFSDWPAIKKGNPQNQPTSTPQDALALAARTEKTWRLKLLDSLKAFIVRIKTSVRAWLDKLLNRPDPQPQTSINEALSSLKTQNPDLGAVLGGFMQFTRDTEADWANNCEKGAAFEGKALEPKNRLDAIIQLRFLTTNLQTHIQDLDQRSAQKILDHLKSGFGLRMRGIIDAVADTLSSQVDNTNSKEAQILSRLARTSSLVVELIDKLHTLIKLPLSEAVPNAPMIKLSELNHLELTSLIGIGLYPNQTAV
ncbi:hypothetical protein NPS46_12995 [Pseudomonas putida]|uniref:hypothetical protein n=1 Tax=Pseudomonas putida TaxID=303 RepID=UPI0023638DC0|nr:hypothetical protein [Pseudomonas putida]MDD2053465.1 hypothetical protein [Pseudomonas putida]